ncbi:MAG TPA: sulfotransferase family protein [Aliidongia sp.]|nr:sulfotransferase family protein [Aliidongia sp.]
MTLTELSVSGLDRLAELLARDHPSLKYLRLPGDGKYQTVETRLDRVMADVRDHLAVAFHGRATTDFPMLYCAWGRARVGSTALNNLFGMAGLPSYYQPVKAVMRSVLAESAPSVWQLPEADAHPHIFIKETAGPYLPAECLYLPLQVLLEAGYPADRLHLLILDRDPLASLASWLAKWSDRVAEPVLVQHFILATLNAARVRAHARRAGIPTTHYVYEASKEPAETVGALFSRLGLDGLFGATVIDGWQGAGELDAAGTIIRFPEEPGIYAVPGLHASASSYRYHERTNAARTQPYEAVLARYGIADCYRDSVTACIADLELDAALSRRLFTDGSDAPHGMIRRLEMSAAD